MIYHRQFAMPNSETFSLCPLAKLLGRYLIGADTIVDPFARSSSRGNITNDLNPGTTAQFHMDAIAFLAGLKGEIKADRVLFDPPYSPRQIAECYQQVGRPCRTQDTQNARLYRAVKDGLDALLVPGGIAICCGWNSMGFGLKRRYEMLEVLLIPHGAAHNDTIVTVEQKL